LFEQSIYTLKNEEQESKTGPVLEWVSRGGYKGKDEYNGHILYLCMIIKQ
jgi:hypothetical protein